jgi:hypothetical protein
VVDRKLGTESIHYWATDVSARGIIGELHFGWIHEGRALQDVWIMRSEGTADLEETMNIYGTTLRVWDPSIQAWRITWINPVGNHREEQEAPVSGKKVMRFAQILVSGTGSVPGMVCTGGKLGESRPCERHG